MIIKFFIEKNEEKRLKFSSIFGRGRIQSRIRTLIRFSPNPVPDQKDTDPHNCLVVNGEKDVMNKIYTYVKEKNKSGTQEQERSDSISLKSLKSLFVDAYFNLLSYFFLHYL